jgi:formylglycine-generating enzyme required for sulfatase activity
MRHRYVKHRLIVWMLCGMLWIWTEAVAIGQTTEGVPRPSFLTADYHALVVGVSRYAHWPVLPNAAADARQVAGLLEQGGFKVSLLIDPDSLQFKAALGELTDATGQTQDRSILFYYAGHGETQSKADGSSLGWIVPRDCPLARDSSAQFAENAISLKDLEASVRRMKSRQVLMVFDTSFAADPFVKGSPALRIIDKVKLLPARQVIIAGKAHEPVPDRSVFKEYFLKALKGEADVIHDGYLSGSELAAYLASRVVTKTHGGQHPQYARIADPDLSAGDFVFAVIAVKADMARLYVDPDPREATVRILNIRPSFRQGMELAPGKYQVEVTAPGYAAKTQWFSLAAGEDKTVSLLLEKTETQLINSMGMKFVRITPGRFKMGSAKGDPRGQEDEMAFEVTLSKEFYIQTTEVTVEQFGAFVRASGHKTDVEKSGGCWTSARGDRWQKQRDLIWSAVEKTTPGRDKFPVACVSWNDAMAFAKWLSKKEGRAYDLPTEAQWEYACRAGTTTPFAFGNCLSTDDANYASADTGPLDCRKAFKEGRQRLLPAASLKANAWGLFDLHGNLAEWCRDWYGSYPSKPTKDPLGPADGTEKAIRGGHYLAQASACRSASRSRFLPASASSAIGFRLVLAP